MRISPDRTVRLAPAALAPLVVASLLALAGCGSGANDAVPADAVDSGGSASTPAATTTPADGDTTSSGSPTTSDSASGSTGGAGTAGYAAISVYFVGDTPDGPRLFREFRSVAADTTTSERMAAAVALLVTGRALDPDYSTLLPSGMQVTDVTLSDGKILVAVGPDSQTSADKSVSPSDAKLAVQQLVYTLQGVTQTRDAVQVVQSDGRSEVPVPLLGVDTTRGVRAAKPLKVLGLVNVTEPGQGSSISAAAGTLHASGVASSFEATVPWKLVKGDDADGTVVQSGAAAASGFVNRLYPWSVDVDLSDVAPGTYTFVAATDDPSGKGRVTTDTKTFDVT